jgi:preprotein translocase subunit SecA
MQELDMLTAINPEINTLIQSKITEIGQDNFLNLLRRFLLQSLDMFWIDHLEAMSYVRSAVALRAYGQRDPLIEYQREGRTMFENLKNSVTDRVVSLIQNIDEQAFKQEEDRVQKAMLQAQKVGGTGGTAVVSEASEYSRNDLVTIIKDGQEQTLKFKKAEHLLGEGWEIKK